MYCSRPTECGTFSEGINIKNIHNVVFASSYKSKIKVLQSLGRGLRKLGTKVLRLFDIVDNVSTLKRDGITAYVNHSVRHYKQRKTIYKKQGFSVKEVNLDVEYKGKK